MYWQKRPHPTQHPKKELGLIHVYTGTGKGKTSSALGLALRAIGHNLQVLVVQFIKGHKDYGEILIQERLQPQLHIVQFGTPEPTDLTQPSAMDHYLAGQALEFTRKAMVTQRPDVLILDEINPAIAAGLLDIKEVLDFLDNKHQQTEVILTGRDAPPELLNAADLVTIMTSSKDPYSDADFLPRFGVEH